MANKTQAILEAKELLGISDSATLYQIKEKYRRLMRKWHPDKCGEDEERCREMAAELTGAYRIVLDYCNAYRFSFSEDDIAKQCGGGDWWLNRFGDDPIWA